MFGLIPNNLSSYGNETVAVPHPPLRGTFPPGEGISANPQSFKQQFIARIPLVFFHNYKLLPTFCQCQTRGGREIFQGKGGFAPLPYCFFPGEKL